MGIGSILLDITSPVLEAMAPFMPGEIFPYFFSMDMLQRAMLAAIMVTIVAGVLGTFLLIQNLALIGDGLAHVSFGGVAVGIVLGATSPLWYALVFSVIAAILIHEMQSREMLTGDASIAIFLTGMLALGLVILRVSGGGITSDIHSYLFGNLLLIVMFLRNGLLATAIDPISARVQGLPVRNIGLLFSITTAAVVVSMVQVVGTLLVTALLVTPAATAKLVGTSFKSCLLWTQLFGLLSVLIGLFFSAEMDTGSGSMIALVAALIFTTVAVGQIMFRAVFNPRDNA